MRACENVTDDCGIRAKMLFRYRHGTAILYFRQSFLPVSILLNPLEPVTDQSARGPDVELQTYMQVVSFLSKLQNMYEQKTAKRVCVAKRQECGTGIGSEFNPSK